MLTPTEREVLENAADFLEEYGHAGCQIVRRLARMARLDLEACHGDAIAQESMLVIPQGAYVNATSELMAPRYLRQAINIDTWLSEPRT